VVFEGGLEGMGGGIYRAELFEATKLGCSSSGDPYRSKVAEEMLLCGHRSVQVLPKHFEVKAAYEGAMQQDCEASFSARQLPTDCFDIKRICLIDLLTHGQDGMVDESIALLEEMYTHL
jgi:hypothetical protein